MYENLVKLGAERRREQRGSPDGVIHQKALFVLRIPKAVGDTMDYLDVKQRLEKIIDRQDLPKPVLDELLKLANEFHQAWADSISGGVYPNPSISEEYKPKNRVKENKKKYYEKKAAKLPCDLCGKVLKSEKRLENHKRFKHGQSLKIQRKAKKQKAEKLREKAIKHSEKEKEQLMETGING